MKYNEIFYNLSIMELILMSLKIRGGFNFKNFFRREGFYGNVNGPLKMYVTLKEGGGVRENVTKALGEGRGMRINVA